MKKFYKQAAVTTLAEGYGIELDGRAIKTPTKSDFVVPTLALAEAISQEWQSQGDDVDLKNMALTTFSYASIDRVGIHRDLIIDEVTAYAATDLLCYPAENPQELVALQAAKWPPLLLWAKEALGVDLHVAQGIIALRQPDASMSAARGHVAACDNFTLAGLDRLTHIMGSLVLALAVVQGHVTAEEAYELGHIEERWQAETWGSDEEANQRHEARIGQAKAAEQLIRMVAVAGNN